MQLKQEESPLCRVPMGDSCVAWGVTKASRSTSELSIVTIRLYVRRTLSRSWQIAGPRSGSMSCRQICPERRALDCLCGVNQNSCTP